MAVAGVTADVFAGNESGLHLRPTIGLGSFTVSDPNSGTIDSARGFGYGLLVGYEYKLAPKWYVGFGGRILGTSTTRQNASQKALAFAFVADALYF
jgi:hypothetical protein